MVKAFDVVKVCKGSRSLEVRALFDTGSAKSYVAEKLAMELGYESYEEHVKIRWPSRAVTRTSWAKRLVSLK